MPRITKRWLWIGGSVAVMAGLMLALWKPSGSDGSGGQELTLFCAAGLLPPVREICERYQGECGVKVRIEPDASGPLLGKLRIAPDRADLYLSGEESFMRDAQSQGLVADSLPVARQRVALAVGAGNPRKIAGVEDLLKEGIKVAIPNPEIAAAGKSARKALSATGQWDALEGRSHQPEAKVSVVGKVTEAAQAVKVGSADAALVWDATARQFGLEMVEVAAFRNQQPEDVMLGVVSAGRDHAAALRFARYVAARDRGQEAFEKFHLAPIPDAQPWKDVSK
jgi:molybdenum ABC transporter molybdate-binding protein